MFFENEIHYRLQMKYTKDLNNIMEIDPQQRPR